MGWARPRWSTGVRPDGTGEVVVDDRLGVDVGERIDLAGTELTVVGVAHGLTLLGGIPNVYASIDDVQEIAFQGAPLITTVVTTGTPDRADHRPGGPHAPSRWRRTPSTP